MKYSYRRVVLMVSIVLCVIWRHDIVDTLADTILANEVRQDDREVPPTAVAIRASADDVQLLGGMGQGLSCSLPRGAQEIAFHRKDGQAPIALQMRQACAFHDYCYRHGSATYGYTQADCDFMLQQHAFRLCKYIQGEASIHECETNARKVTIGVRMGGWGSFRSARALGDDAASTFFEFDPYPVRSRRYRVVRIADAPPAWRGPDFLPKAAYAFEVRPSGSRVTVVGWTTDGEQRCTAFEIPAKFDAIHTPPMVVRAGGTGEDWLVWWRRETLTDSRGRFAAVAPARATQADWELAVGGPVVLSDMGCGTVGVWANPTLSGAKAAFVTDPGGPRDLGFSEIQPLRHTAGLGRLRLMALSTHGCFKDDPTLCLVDVELDSLTGMYANGPTSYRLYECPADEVAEHLMNELCRAANIAGKADRYRNHVMPPFPIMHDGRPGLTWLARGASDGQGYEQIARLRRFAIGPTPKDKATPFRKKRLTTFGEDMEPLLVLDNGGTDPQFLTLKQDGTAGRVQMKVHQSGEWNGESGSTPVNCQPPDASWLARPPALLQNSGGRGIHRVVFSKVVFASSPHDMPDRLELRGDLHVAVATLHEGRCSLEVLPPFERALDRFALGEERASLSASVKGWQSCRSHTPDCALHAQHARKSFAAFVKRVRGGQMTVSTFAGHSSLTLVFVEVFAAAEGEMEHVHSLVVRADPDSGKTVKLPQ